jgi:hypothetical protein
VSKEKERNDDNVSVGEEQSSDDESLLRMMVG